MGYWRNGVMYNSDDDPASLTEERTSLLDSVVVEGGQ